MRIKFQQNLDELKERLLVMAGLVEQAIQRATEAYSTRDLGLCELVVRSEPAINRMEREIDQAALDLLAMEQPMAVDLRFILAVIRINADLERVGDSAVSIALRVQQMGMFANEEILWTSRSWLCWPLPWCARRCRRLLRAMRIWHSPCCCWMTRWTKR